MNKGDLRSAYDLAADRQAHDAALSQARDAKLTHDLNMSEGGAEAAGRINSQDGEIRQHQSSHARDEDRKARSRADQMLLRRLAQELAEIERELSQLYGERERLGSRRDAFETRLTVMDGGIAILESGDSLALDEQGRLADPRLEAEIAAYETRTGRQIDRAEPDLLLSALTAQRAFVGAEFDAVDDAYRENEQTIRALEERRAELQAQQFEAQNGEPSPSVRQDRVHGMGANRLADQSLGEDDIGFFMEGFDDDYASFADEADPIDVKPEEPAEPAPEPSEPSQPLKPIAPVVSP